MAISPVTAQALANPMVPDIAGAFQKGRQFRQQQDELARQQKARELQSRVVQSQFDPQSQLFELAGVDAQAALTTMNALGIPVTAPERLKQFAQQTQLALGLAESGRPQEALQSVLDYRANLKSKGIDTSNIDQFLGQVEQAPDGALETLRGFNQHFMAMGLIQPAPLTEQEKSDIQQSRQLAVETEKQRLAQEREIAVAERKAELAQEKGASEFAGIAEMEFLIKDLSPEDKAKAKRVKLGLDPRASESAVSKAMKAQAVEMAKLTAQLKLAPQVAGAVQAAKNESNILADDKKVEKSNQKAWDVYDGSMRNLSNSLAGTETGPFAGLIPAITANQQIAEGAVAVMAPVLKQMFRAAGEGVFTDKDQAMLMQMVPTRTDLPEARAAKITAIDAIVRAKLGMADMATGVPVAPAAPQAAPEPVAPAKQQVIEVDF